MVNDLLRTIFFPYQQHKEFYEINAYYSLFYKMNLITGYIQLEEVGFQAWGETKGVHYQNLYALTGYDNIICVLQRTLLL